MSECPPSHFSIPHLNLHVGAKQRKFMRLGPWYVISFRRVSMDGAYFHI
jgi:hypothetical protein